MEPLKDKKRHVCSLVLYSVTDGVFSYFLQKRGKDAPTNPDKFGLFGGGLEDGETAEEALLREMEEELEYKPQKHAYFSRYENSNRVYEVFLEEVDADFASRVTVHEGQYGKFLSAQKVATLEDVGSMTRLIIREVDQYLAQK